MASNIFINLCLLKVLILFMETVSGSYDYHKGIYSGSLSHYDIVTPKIISPHGFETDIGVYYKDRNKRDISGDRKLHIKISILDKEEILIVWPSYNFLANNLKVEVRRNNSVSHSLSSKNTCHYRGTIHGQSNSSVAISLCNGIIGYLKTLQGEFWIEPSRNTSSSKERIHLLYKRNAVKHIFSKRKRKRKKKYSRLCGTREPRRVKKSHLEWNQTAGRLRVQGRGKNKGHKSNRTTSNKKRRKQRSVSKEQYVETLVVADSSLVDFYQSEDIETYLLSIMNMVSVMYQDPSIGNYIHIVVVRIIILEDDTQGLNVSVNADRTLDSFCRWQESLNEPDESNLLHHDVAIMITRKDICAGADTPCSTLGVAHVAGMCQPFRSCSVNEDNGITLAHTVAHELGHNFGMYHDSMKIGCSGRDGLTLHVMTPSFEADTLQIAWSSCSRRDITHFLDGGQGKCLEDKPVVQIPLSYPEVPVGILYNAEHQCKLQFGVENTTVCIPLEEICARLWCIVDDSCTTMLHPAAPGTRCGKHSWCEHQQCVGMEEKLKSPVNGGWGKWSQWSACSRKCGAGVSITERFCDHPPPSNGGKYCLGQRTRYKICNTQDCTEPFKSFRGEQCSTFNNITLDGKSGVMWLPYFEATEPCQLYCIDKDDTTIMPMGIPVLDGTPCNLGTRDMCISGLCRKVGCDWIVDSNAVEDKCGVCRGDGSKCITTSGFYNETNGSGYIDLVSIPKYARNIVVEELGNSKNYIAVGSTLDDLFYLNGNKAITLPGEYSIAGSQALYTRQKDKEKLHIVGPINDEILIYLIFQGSNKNPGVRFEYTVPNTEDSSKAAYEWGLSEWTACSVTCGGGVQHARPVCKEREVGIVDNHLCSSDQKPAKKMRTCNLQPCTHRWWTGPWQVCPVTCGDLAMRRRTVLCVSNDIHLIALPDTDCEDQPRPLHEEPCTNIPSCLSSVHMFTNNSDSRYMKQHHKKKRMQFKAGSGLSVDKWITLPWSQCSISCGLGFKKRTVLCSKELCDLTFKPVEVKQCFKNCQGQNNV